jgi:TatA/E family protein of Tat protein translocase
VGIENPVHLLFVAVVALVVLGPRRLPELAKALGKGVREFREAVSVGSADATSHVGEPPVPAQDVSSTPVEPAVGGSVSSTQEQDAWSDPPEPVPSGDASDRRAL